MEGSIMKNYFLTFALAVLVVLTGVSLKQSMAAIGGSPIPNPPSLATAIGGSPIPNPPATAAIGGSPIPNPPVRAAGKEAR